MIQYLISFFGTKYVKNIKRISLDALRKGELF